MSLVPTNRGPAEEELEELGDDVIIAQQTLAHAPPAAAQVQDEQRSVVISDKPPGAEPAPSTSGKRARSRGESLAKELLKAARPRHGASKSATPVPKERRDKPPPLPAALHSSFGNSEFVIPRHPEVVRGHLEEAFLENL